MCLYLHLDTCDYPDSRLNKWQWEEAQNGVQTSHSYRYVPERYKNFMSLVIVLINEPGDKSLVALASTNVLS